MSKPKGFSDEVESLSSAIDADVGRVVTMLRSGAPPASGSSLDPPPTATKTRTRERNQRQQDTPHGPASTVHPHDATATLVNVTTRLPHATNELLSECALRQKLAKRKPDNRQDIVAEALVDWFRKHGYSDRS